MNINPRHWPKNFTARWWTTSIGILPKDITKFLWPMGIFFYNFRIKAKDDLFYLQRLFRHPFVGLAMDLPHIGLYLRISFASLVFRSHKKHQKSLTVGKSFLHMHDPSIGQLFLMEKLFYTQILQRKQPNAFKYFFFYYRMFQFIF